MKHALDKFRILNTIALVVFCIAIGQVMSALLTAWVFDLNTSQISSAVQDPGNADRNLITLLSVSYSLFSFLILPVVYFILTKKRAALKFLFPENKITFTRFLLSIAIVLAVTPLIAILIKLNHSITFPGSFTELEKYFRSGEESARHMTAALLSFKDSDDLLIALLIIAIIPGIVEELFFRGIVQTQLRDTFTNVHYAIWVSAFLFSLFHFQFYAFIPRLVLGGLLGYIFSWTRNIWYACAAHIVNNMVGVLGFYFMGTKSFETDRIGFMLMVLLIPSIVVTTLLIWLLKRNDSKASLTKRSNFRTGQP